MLMSIKGSFALLSAKRNFSGERAHGSCWTHHSQQCIKLITNRRGDAIDRELAIADHMHGLDASAGCVRAVDRPLTENMGFCSQSSDHIGRLC
jgi:hypothetical protein